MLESNSLQTVISARTRRHVTNVAATRVQVAAAPYGDTSQRKIASCDRLTSRCGTKIWDEGECSLGSCFNMVEQQIPQMSKK